HPPIGSLREWIVQLGPRRVIYAAATRVPDDADDGQPPRSGIRRVVVGDVFAQGVAVWEETSDQRLVDHHNALRRRAVRVGKQATPAQRNPESPEESLCDRIVRDWRVSDVWVQRRAALNRKVRRLWQRRQQQRAAESDRFDTG